MEEAIKILQKYSKCEQLLMLYDHQTSNIQEASLTPEETFENLYHYIKESIIENPHDFLFFLRLLRNIAINHNNGNNFNEKLSHLMIKLKPILDKLENTEIKEEYEFIIKYSSENQNNNQKINEVEQTLIELIKKDSVSEFMKFIDDYDFSTDATIDFSKYDKRIKADNYSIISYCAFLGSIQLFRYLLLNKVSVDPVQICYCAIYSLNYEIIHSLEEYNYLTLDQPFYISLIKAAIKMHHNEIANYLIEKKSGIDNCNSKELLFESLEYCNCPCITQLLPKHANDLNDIFSHFGSDEYYHIVEKLLIIPAIDINHTDAILTFIRLMI